MRIFTPQGYIPVAALMFELTDEQLEIIRADNGYWKDAHFLAECIKSKGNNIHIYSLSNTNCRRLNIKQYVSILLKEYKSVSWWDKDMKRFVIKRR